MNALTIFTIVALVAAATAEDAQATKKQEKRGVLGLGYGGFADHGLAVGGIGYTGGLGHGYVAAAPAYTVNHAVAAPVVSSVSSHGIANAPIIPAAPIRVGFGHGLGYSGFTGVGLGHEVAYGHGF